MTDPASRPVVARRPRLLTPEGFAPYGKLLDREQFVLTSTEFPFFANVPLLRPPDDPITYVNRHHDHNQVFASFGEPMIVVVARPTLSAAELQLSQIEAFVADGTQAFVLHVDTWHLEPRAHGPTPIRALNVQATNNRVHTERVDLEPTFGCVIGLDIPRMATLREKVAASHARLVGLVDGVSEERLLTPEDGWSVKDHLAHVAAWEKSLIALLEGRDRSAAVGVGAPTGASASAVPSMSTDAINAIIYRQNHDRSLAEVLAEFHETHARTLAVLDRLSDLDLLRPYAHYQPASSEKRAVIGWIAGNTWEHYAEHAEGIERILGAR